jgi:hypothetical protein
VLKSLLEKWKQKMMMMMMMIVVVFRSTSETIDSDLASHLETD